ncbi:MAG TPA: RluA family pseudouridine synthase [Candidatus Polarisedimenticolaceae bacterium]|nr:RluA family pseudouridine synthase [Candidatus Polarisedimenticolaceae bacterium]
MSEPVTRFAIGPRDAGKRLDRLLHERIPGLSRTRIQRAIRERVTLSWGVTARPATPVRPGGEVHIGWTPLPETPCDVPLPVLARGRGWLAVDKPPGIPVHPAHRVRENSLIRMLRRQQGEPALRLVHRLDRDTSGVLLVAEDAATARSLSLAFEQRRVHKEYLALVAGDVAGDAGRIDLPIGRDPASRIYVRLRAGTGAEAVTDWRVERRLGGRTLLRLFPHTGRRHQLRVHLEALGHPILGDPLYGRPDRDWLDLVAGRRDARREAGEPARTQLHCARLVFPDPEGGTARDVTAAPPADLLASCSDGLM